MKGNARKTANTLSSPSESRAKKQLHFHFFQFPYTDEEFNIREDSSVNNGGSPITCPVEAAQLALKEYPNLGDYLSPDVFRDDTTGMWKVTTEAYVDYQSTYAYRDVYLSDSGATQLLVYEGPIRFDESRK